MAPETPKGVSSRLLTMKFMQRAAASASPNGSPDSDVPSSKKRKFDHSPAPGRINPNIDQALIKAALDDQEATRQAALEKHSSADTHWVLKSSLNKTQSAKPSCPLNFVYVGYGDIDSSNDSGDNEDKPAEGRTSTKLPKTTDAPNNTQSNDKSDGSSDSESDATSHRRTTERNTNSKEMSRSRSQSRSRQSSESARLKEFRDKRKRKEVRLNKLTSISSAGDGQFGSQSSPNTKAMKCYTCQQVGHKASDCPTRK